LSIAKHGAIRVDTIWDLKSQAVKKSGLATIYRGNDTFDSLGGMDALKDLCRKALRPDCPVSAKGFILLSPPGCGKTSIAKAISGEMRRPLLICDMGMLKDKHVGESEAKMRRFIQVAEAMAPCVVLVDEIEKALAGASAQHQGDSGVSADQLRTLLTWRQDSTAPVFVIGTCNDAQAITKVSSGALQIWRKQFAIDDAQKQPDDTGWTGAEIKACCRKSLMYDLSLQDAAVYVTHIDSEQIESLRAWASGRCLSASTAGIYQRESAAPAKSGRRINRGPSVN
jgi:ATPase family associated with various cellular activities (AAA)